MLVTTIVSSDMVDKIAEEYKVQVERTLTGFKYIGERLEELKERYIFGFEEGYGYLAGDFVRDKDSHLQPAGHGHGPPFEQQSQPAEHSHPRRSGAEDAFLF